MKFININIESNIAILTISRPKYLNALNQKLIEEFSNKLDLIRSNEKIRVVIISGEGNKSFVAGADIKEFANFNKEEGELLSKNGHDYLFDKIANFNKPVIAAINGYALGGGLELALACHIRIASINAKMGLPECSLGLIPGYGGTQRLVRIIGESKASEMILTSKIVNAQDAEKIGLVSSIFNPDQLMEGAINLANACIKNSPKALEKAIMCINKNFDNMGLQFEQKAFGSLFATNEFKEGVSAFLDKRKPNF